MGEEDRYDVCCLMGGKSMEEALENDVCGCCCDDCCCDDCVDGGGCDVDDDC